MPRPVLVTGAAGQVGSALVRHLRSAGRDVIATDAAECDIRSDSQVASLFDQNHFSTVVHLAAILPTAFRSDPLAAAGVNLSGALHLLKASIGSGVRRFIFGSSASVYGELPAPNCCEDADPAPTEPYGAAKLAIERILETLPSQPLQTVSLRIARVLGPGVKASTSTWRSRIFEYPDPPGNHLEIPFAPGAILSLVHVDDLARMLRILVDAPRLPHTTYNTPVELMRADALKQLVETERGWQVSLGSAHGGPQIVGRRFTDDFAFVPRSLEQHLREPTIF